MMTKYHSNSLYALFQQQHVNSIALAWTLEFPALIFDLLFSTQEGSSSDVNLRLFVNRLEIGLMNLILGGI